MLVDAADHTDRSLVERSARGDRFLPQRGSKRHNPQRPRHRLERLVELPFAGSHDDAEANKQKRQPDPRREYAVPQCGRDLRYLAVERCKKFGGDTNRCRPLPNPMMTLAAPFSQFPTVVSISDAAACTGEQDSW